MKKPEKLKPDFGMLDAGTIRNNIHEIVENSSEMFPVDVFPKSIQDIILATNESLKFPTDFMGASFLYAASVAIGNTFKLQVKRSWLESAVLYVAIVGRPGTTKSHPLSFALKPLNDKDNKYFNEYDKKKAEYEKLLLLPKKEKNKADNPTKPVLKKHIVSDVTPEALAYVHKFNKRGLGVYHDEFASWIKNFNRYKKGAEQELFMTNWSGKPIIIDRVSGEHNRIASPFISVCGTIQPSMLKEITKDNRGENGFIDRILFVMKKNLKKEKWNDSDLENLYIESWKSIINRLLNIELEYDKDMQPKSKKLIFSDAAKDIIKQWQAYNTDIINYTKDETLAGVYTKLEQYCLRFCIILHCLHYACGEELHKEISRKVVEDSIKLIEYFRHTAESVHNIICNASSLDVLPEHMRKLYSTLSEVVKTKDAIKEGAKYQIGERTIKRLLANKELFRWLKQGLYEKIL